MKRAKIYYITIRPLLHKIKRFRNFLRDLLICIVRGWDLRLLTSCDMNITKIPASTHFGHPVGIVISSKARIGENCKIMQNVTVGERGKHMVPSIGDNVSIGTGAILLGEINIGDNAVIGAGAIVLQDVPDNMKYVSKYTPCFFDK